MSRAEIALEIARDYDDVGEWERSLRAAQAGAGFTGPDDRLLRVRLLIEVANRQRYLNRWAEGIATFHEARALLDEDGDAAERALLARIDAPLVADDERNWPNAVELIDRAVALAESSGDSTALSIALDRRAYVQAACLGVDSALENERRAHSLPGSMDRRMKTSNNLMDILSKAGRYDEALEIGRSAYDEAVLGGRGRGLGASILANLAETEAFLGNVDSSIALGERAILLLPDPDQQKLVLRVLATATMWDARSDQSGIYLERAKSTRATGTELDEEIAWLQFDGYAALVAAGLEGQVDDATGLAARIADQFDSFPGTQFEGMRWFSERLLPLAGWLLQRAPEVRDILRPSMDRALARPDSGKHSAAWKSVGLAFRDSGVAPWREAVARTEEGRMPTVFVHLSRLRLAEALIAEGERDEASILLDRVMEEAPMHGATLVANWAREFAVRAGLTPSGTDAAPLAVVLTPRERQVLALVAEGLTNPQIGARLYISPKTASVHVSAILTKIGAANRTEAAAIYSASPAPRPAAVVSL
jgi:DNA-binding CsgD family transcriptional regulator